MTRQSNAHPTSLTAERRAEQVVTGVVCTQGHCTRFRPVLLQAAKRGRIVVLAKIVIPKSLNKIAVAVPYRHRQAVEHPSLTPATLEVARRMGAEWWIVRFDFRRVCYGLQLSEVEKAGTLRSSEGKPEWFVQLSKFEKLAWQEWHFIPGHDGIRVDLLPTEGEVKPEATDPHPRARRLILFEDGGRRCP